MNYFQYYKELTQRLLPVRGNAPLKSYHKRVDINVNACKTAFDSFAGRTMTMADFDQLFKLCLNGKDKGSYVIWKQVRFTEPAYFTVSRQGYITRIEK